MSKEKVWSHLKKLKDLKWKIASSCTCKIQEGTSTQVEKIEEENYTIKL